MATFTKINLSGSTGGMPVVIGETSGSGNIIHTTGTSASILDEIWIYANNIDTTDRKLTIQYGGTADSNLIEITIPAEAGLVLVIPGLLLAGDGSSGRVVRAIAAAGDVINITGYVNRIS